MKKNKSLYFGLVMKLRITDFAKPKYSTPTREQLTFNF